MEGRLYRKMPSRGVYKVNQSNYPVPNNHKRCTRCGFIYLLDKFEKSAVHLKGRRPECKMCSKTPARIASNRAKALRYYHKNKSDVPIKPEILNG